MFTLNTPINLALCTLVVQSMAQDYPQTAEEQNKAGAEGPSSEGVGMSSTGMIVLCTIVGVVVVIGSEYFSGDSILRRVSLTHFHSFFSRTLRCCQKASMGNARDNPSFRSACHSSYQNAFDSPIPSVTSGSKARGTTQNRRVQSSQTARSGEKLRGDGDRVHEKGDQA